MEKRLGWFLAAIDRQGFLTLSSASSTTIELSLLEALRLLQFLYADLEHLEAKAREQEAGGQN